APKPRSARAAAACVSCVNRHLRVRACTTSRSEHQIRQTRSDPRTRIGAFSFCPSSPLPPTAMRPIAVYHEHPDWFKPLFTELERRGLPYVRLDAAAHRFDPAERTSPYSVVVNRASPSAYLRGHGQSTFHTLHWLRHLERIGVPVVNGSKVYGYELSKATQLDALAELGLPFPRSVAINDPS